VSNFVGQLTAENLVERAVRNARNSYFHDVPRWVAVRDAFGVGSTVARELCGKFNLNPDEMLPGGTNHPS
jgi:hypothetical protein